MEHLRKREAERVLRDLEGKSHSVRTGAPEKVLGLVAKNVEGTEKLREEGFIVFELGEMFPPEFLS